MSECIALVVETDYYSSDLLGIDVAPSSGIANGESIWCKPSSGGNMKTKRCAVGLQMRGSDQPSSWLMHFAKERPLLGGCFA
jgi:hypothetical protein